MNGAIENSTIREKIFIHTQLGPSAVGEAVNHPGPIESAFFTVSDIYRYHIPVFGGFQFFSFWTGMVCEKSGEGKES